MKPLKIVSLPVDRGGCGWYRVRQPLSLIKEQTEHDTFIVDMADPEVGMKTAQALKVADICVIRQGGELSINAYKSTPEFSHLKYVLDIDDNIELISPYSQHYEEYGTQEFFDRNDNNWLWKHGEKNFNVVKNRGRVLSLMVGMKEADLITVTTQKLADYARQFNKNVAVLPNMIDFAQWWPLDFAPHKQLRIGWSGGMSHYEDWEIIREPLNKLLRKYKFKLVVVGSHFDGLIDEDLKKYVEVHPWVAFEAHSFHMMAMNLDIAVIPLADLPFNHYKSAVKLLEMSAMAVPSLVSNCEPYSPFINDLDVLGYRNNQEFEERLEQLILDGDLRKQIGTNALDWVRDNFDASKNAHLWTDAYASLIVE